MRRTYLAIGLVALVLLPGCSTTAGKTSVQTVNLVRGIGSGSYSGQGLNERVLNCFMASVDTNNRGGPCSR
jgi:hypothetical protein